MEPSERVEEVSPQLSADGDAVQSAGRTSVNLGTQIYRPAVQDQSQSRLERDGWGLQQQLGSSFQPEFQDSNLSPALPLLTVNPGVENNFTEYSLLQQSGNEFAPLRAYPDISMPSEVFQFPHQDHTTLGSECGSLSQHPLAQATIVSEEGVNSSCSLSLIDEGQQEETFHSLPFTTDRQRASSTDHASIRDEADNMMPTSLPDKPVEEGSEDETFFLSKDIPAQHLLQLLQKDMGMPSSSSSAVSTGSESSVKAKQRTEAYKQGIDQSMVRREGPPGEASLPQQQTQQPDRDLCPDQSLSSEVCNITMGVRSTKPDDSSEALHRQLLSESRAEPPSKSQQQIDESLTPYPTGTSEVKSQLTRTNVGDLPWTGAFSAGAERGHRGQDLWLSGNQTGIDGSYLGFLPQSQSTPGVFKAPPKSNVKAMFGQLSAIGSNKESCPSTTGISLQPDVPVADVHCPDTTIQSKEEATTAKVQSLPSLNYMQKVDAWRANQSSGKTSLFDSLALQGFSGISPKKKAYDAISDPLNRILSQQVRSLQQPLQSAPNPNVVLSSSTGRGEAVGSAPSDKDNTASATRPSASPRSQTHSSVSTIVMSGQNDEMKEMPAAEEDSQVQHVQHQPGVTAQPFPRMSLSQFSDVSLDRDVTLSSSQDSYNSGIKLGASIGASSIVSLEVDNYVPNWTSKLSTPPPLPRLRELNIEERIPLYLHNLGIDQSPSTILTPFAPRGPIREPEFSPTDLCTIKGSVGTPTKSTQLSEGGSPHKGEFSRSSIVSADSSVSIPFSVDSLPQQAGQSLKLASSLPDEDSYPSSQQQLMTHDSSLTSSQNTIQLRDRLNSDLSLAAQSRCEDRVLEQNAEDSVVSSKALSEIHKLLSQAEKVLSGSSEANSASSVAPYLRSDDDIVRSQRKKTSKLQDSSFSSTPAEDPRTQSSVLWTRSSSDSMLAGERGISVDQERFSYPTKALLMAQTPGAHRAQDGASSSRAPSRSGHRAEPEGCSAAPPDRTAPPQPPALSTQQLSAVSRDAEEDTHTAQEGDEPSSRSSPDSDPGVVSDGSSESSLAVRVAKLLQSESPATMVSSTASITDQEESKAREWIKLKLSGQQCVPLELDKEDRKRIEEIKRELLLKNPIKSDTDTESSSAYSVRVQREQEVEPIGHLSARNHTDLSDSSAQPQKPLCSDLEAQVREIAAREGVSLPRTNPQAFTSITISTCRRSSSSSPSKSSAPELLHLSELTTGKVEDDEAARESASVFEPRRRLDIRKLTLSAPVNQKRQDTVGGDQFDLHPCPSQGSGGEHHAEQPADSSTAEPPNRTDHVSHVHLTLSPKASDHSLDTAVHSNHADGVTGLSPKDFVPLRHSPSAASSPDEGVGLSSPPDWCDSREPVRQQLPERTETSTLVKKAGGSPGPVTCAETPAVPALLPYKPRGSEELFYVPQTEADVSSTERSDTTMESSHTGSDDAVPPHFSSEVLGHRDTGLDRGVTIRHSEGIYSKRLNTAAFKMLEPGGQRDAVAFSRVPLSRRDQATSPMQAPFHVQPEWSRVAGHPVQVDLRGRETSPHHHQSSVPEAGGGPDQEGSGSGLRHPTSQQSGGPLNQLWERFCDRWSPEESREASLLERLERLSRLIHSARGAELQEEQLGRRAEDAVGKESQKHVKEVKRDVGTERTVCGREGEPPIAHQAWTEAPPPAGEDASSFAHDSSLCPADRDESDTSSMSTVDTARLARAFGVHRVQHLKSSSSLSRLYSTIDRQREGREQRRGRRREPPHTSSLTETTSTDVSTVTADSSSASSSSLAATRCVKVVSRGIQAGGLGLLSSGRLTRDVGTTFPSPAEARPARHVSSSSSSLERGRGGWRSPSKSQGIQRKSKRSSTKTHPEATPHCRAVSWFISADDLRSEARKENRPEEEESTWSTAWFEPYSRTRAWREPLRQRQVLEDRSKAHTGQHLGPSTKMSSGLERISLQEALQLRRPEFISQSRQRVERLALQVEHRKQQEVLSGGREEEFSRPAGAGRRLKPAGSAVLRRAVPRKEMLHRSRLIYEKLPEVQRRREEDRRRAEYRSYRLNAQLYNKRITNRVLGRRTAWQ